MVPKSMGVGFRLSAVLIQVFSTDKLGLGEAP